MGVQGRLSELENRHRKLDFELEEERKRPAADTLRMTALKREKLKLKEAIRDLKDNQAA